MQRMNKYARMALLIALLLPLFSMMVVPLYDTSEPRYAEIARVMAQSGDWITPWFQADLPFWGKPPLSFWAQALSMKILGVTEFAARFPSWLCLILSNGILLAGLRSLYGPRVALWAAIIYSTCTLVYISAGAVLTDPFLALGTTLSLISFAVVIDHRNPFPAGTGSISANTPRTGNIAVSASNAAPTHGSIWWQYGFFLGVAIGLLGKGPLAVVLIFAPIAAWYALNRKTTPLASTLPWARGFALVMVISLPWYVMAEIKTPGFLDYFIIGEHVRRFLDPGWKGDLYGTAHKEAYGTIWLYWLQASFPWGVAVLAAIFGAFRSSRLRSTLRTVGRDPLFSYWLAGALFTPLFFTFSANILWTYLLPSLAGLSILVAITADRMDNRTSFFKRVLFTSAGVVPVVVLVLSIIAWVSPDLRNTERGLVNYALLNGESTIPLVYLSKTPFSAQFYSAGKAREIRKTELKRAFERGKPFYLAVPKGKQSVVTSIMRKAPVALYSNKRYILVKITPRSGCHAQTAVGPKPEQYMAKNIGPK